MARKEVQAAISPILPCAHMAWRKGSAPNLPWCVFYEDDMGGFYADGEISSITHWTLELYQEYCDSAIEKQIEEAIVSNFSPFSRYETWVEEEGAILTVYQFTEIPKEKQNG